MDSFIVKPSGRKDELLFMIVDQSFGRHIIVGLFRTREIAEAIARLLNLTEGMPNPKNILRV